LPLTAVSFQPDPSAQIERKPPTHAAPPPEIWLSALMVDYARGEIPGAPDAAILRRIVQAVGDHSQTEVTALFQNRFRAGRRCSTWGWFLTVLVNHFKAQVSA